MDSIASAVDKSDLMDQDGASGGGDDVEGLDSTCDLRENPPWPGPVRESSLILLSSASMN